VSAGSVGPMPTDRGPSDRPPGETPAPTAAELFDLTDRVAIVTGGSRGLGRAIARGFAAAGALVVVASRKAEACDEVVAEIEAAGGAALAVPTHVGRTEDLDALVSRTVEHFGGIGILVNNAANPLGGTLSEMTELAFDKSFQANVRAPVMLAAKALDHLSASGHGSIINVVSAGAFGPGAYLGLYCAGKAALWSFTRVMAKEFAARGVRANALAPGPFETTMMATTLEVPELHDSIVDATLLGRVAHPDELVGAALFLAGDASSYVTGSVVPVDGGILA
jgi:NAD(P)-dependent dehydrogenase (short-subunit alcohol dehydrogenase family)